MSLPQTLTVEGKCTFRQKPKSLFVVSVDESDAQSTTFLGVPEVDPAIAELHTNRVAYPRVEDMAKAKKFDAVQLGLLLVIRNDLMPAKNQRMTIVPVTE